MDYVLAVAALGIVGITFFVVATVWAAVRLNRRCEEQHDGVTGQGLADRG